MAKEIHIKVSEKAYQELAELTQDLKLESISELLKKSVGFQKFLDTQRRLGNELVLKNKRTNEQKTVVF